jgi:hypothetical protein
MNGPKNECLIGERLVRRDRRLKPSVNSQKLSILEEKEEKREVKRRGEARRGKKRDLWGSS